MALRDWLSYSEKIATATTATVATHRSEKAITVANVATVAVAEASDSQSVSTLTLQDEAQLRSGYVEETDQANSAEALGKCQTKPEALDDLPDWSAEIFASERP